MTGISGKSQVLYALVFTTRYLDLFINFVSIYNTTMKIIFILATYATLFLMFYKFRSTYDSHHDTFRAELLVVPCGGLAVLVNHDFTVLEVSHSFDWVYCDDCNNTDIMDVQHLLGVCCHNAAVVYGVKDWRSREYNITLLVCFRLIQSIVPCQLGVSLLPGRIL